MQNRDDMKMIEFKCEKCSGTILASVFPINCDNDQEQKDEVIALLERGCVPVVNRIGDVKNMEWCKCNKK